MKKYIIPAIMLIIIILLTILIILGKDIRESLFNYDGTYTIVTNNYINGHKYSTLKEIYTIEGDNVTYKKIYKYEDSSRQSNTIIYSTELDNKSFTIPNGDKFNVEKNKICNNNDCYTSNEVVKDNKIDDFDKDEHLINLSSLNDIKDDLSIVIISQNGCPNCSRYKNILYKVVYDYDVDFYILDITRLSKKELNDFMNNNDLHGTPTTYIYKDNEIIDHISGVLSEEKLGDLLLNYGINSR